jgi:hypothetical protein
LATEAQGSFRSHANYLRALATLASHPVIPMATPAKALERQRAAVMGVSQRARHTAGCRRDVWCSPEPRERLGNRAAAVRLANNWGAVQVYYVAYHAFQAYLQANGEERPTTHAQTQRMFAARWGSRALQLPPWSFVAKEGGFDNGPPGRVVDLGVHPWTSCDTTNCWDIAAQALRSTREAGVLDAMQRKRENKQKDRRRAWQDEEDDRLAKGRKPRKPQTFPLPQLTGTEKAAVRRGVRRYSAMDYLYRLRIKSNYEDSTMFTDGPQQDGESSHVQSDLVRLATSVLLLHELHIRHLIGRARMTTLVDAWINRNMPSLNVGLVLRRDLIVAP